MAENGKQGLKKDDELELFIEDMGVDGAGIGKLGGMALFVKDAVIGDTVRVKVMKMKKNYGYARLLEVLTPSLWRAEPRCALHRPCGGCQLQALSYEKQLEFKENKVKNSLVRIGGFEDVDARMEPIIGMEEPFHYRNKAQFPIGRDKEGRIVTGFYASRSHTIIPNRSCCLGDKVNERILDIIIRFMEQRGIAPYEESTGSGLVRHVLIRKGFASGEIMVCLVINGRKLPFAEALVEELKKVDGITSISLNVNRENTNVILGNEILLLWGKEYITDSIGDIRYQISAHSFFQVNPVQTKRLYETALDYAGLTGEETVWDLYCGIGSISLFLAQKAKQVYGVEIVPQAVKNARDNAALNGITNARFFEGKAEEVLPEFYREGCEKLPGWEAMLHPDVIVVDPPRKGCDEKCLETIVQMRPDRVVYVSCDPATLARDLKYLCGNGYELSRVRPVDMFAQTVGVETVVLLSKGEVDSKKIRVEFSLEDMDMSEFQDGATYTQIKDYVLEHSGLKVSNLYISQIKRKCGIEVGKNYNLPKSEDSRQPLCPPEKEKAIREAFKYFGMI